MEKQQKLSTESYKGVRDFYPEEMAVQNHIFKTWSDTVEGFGYQEYNASVLEPSELYRAKSGDEIVNEQTYSFKDRGERDVTLRPEMTPTVARMVAGRKRELGFPLRWYSIPNLFRYEQPQRGRLREHWQLNVDIFGVESSEAEVEIITVASDIMKAFGAKEVDFDILVNSREMNDFVLREHFKLAEGVAKKVSKLVDRKAKMEADLFEKELRAHFGATKDGQKSADSFIKALGAKNIADFAKALELTIENISGLTQLNEVISALEKAGIKNVRFSPTLMRGFDYYTGVVFEVFDTNPVNKRSLFGGGRYDDLISLFGNDAVTGVGFGMGDVTIRDFLETHNLLPKYAPTTKLYICVLDAKYFDKAQQMAAELRKEGVAAAIDFTERKVADQIKVAIKQSVPFITVIGEDEAKTGMYKVKELESGKESVVNASQIIGLIKTH